MSNRGLSILEMHEQFKFFLDREDTEVKPEFKKRAVDIYLNRAIEEFVISRYDPVDQISNIKGGFEAVQKRIDDLNTLVKTRYLKAQNSEDHFYYNLNELYINKGLTQKDEDNKYRHYLRSRVDCNGKLVMPNPVKQDNIEILRKDPFNESVSFDPLLYFEDGGIKVVKGDFDSKYIELTFLKHPVKVSLDEEVDCDLPASVHLQIVKNAVQISLEGIESQRQQTHERLLVKSE